MRVRNTEAAVLRGVLDFLQLKGFFAWRASNSGVRRRDRNGREFWSFAGLKGVADVLFVIPPHGRLGACECKAPGGKLTPEQAHFLDTINRLGGVGVCVRSVADLEMALMAEGIIP